MIDFDQDYVLENDLVRLTPLTMDGVSALLEYSENEPELWKYALITAQGKENLEKYIHLALQMRNNQLGYAFIVFDKRANKYVGSTRFYDITVNHKTLSLGYTWYGKNFQGTGLNKHCKYLMLQLAFEQWDMKRIEFRANTENKRSIQTLKNIGCVEEGVLRSNFIEHDGKRRDSIVMSILQEEWHSRVANELAHKLYPR